jgi:hypothetical protein
VTELLRQSGGFEGFPVFHKYLLTYNLSGRDREEVGPFAVYNNSAAEATARNPPNQQYAIPEVDDLFGLESELAPLIDPSALEADAVFTTAIQGLEAEPDELRRGDQLPFRVW